VINTTAGFKALVVEFRSI